MEIEMRELTGQDTFLLLPIVAKLGVMDAFKRGMAKRDELVAVMKAEDKELTDDEYQEVGMAVMGELLEGIMLNSYKAQKEINKLMASVLDKTIKEVESLDFATYNKCMIELFSQEAFINFFKQLFS